MKEEAAAAAAAAAAASVAEVDDDGTEPVDADKLYQLAHRTLQRLGQDLGTCNWPPLSVAQKKEMDGVKAMLVEALNQVSEITHWRCWLRKEAVVHSCLYTMTCLTGPR